MRTLLIVCPHFPPINGADMHRVRTSLPYYREFGWEPTVLAVEPASIAQDWQDEELLQSIPADVRVERVTAWPYRLTRALGIGAIGLRAFRPMKRAGRALIRECRPDLVFFSTTAFPLMVLGRTWKREFALPYVLDMQDPWVPDAPAADAALRRGLKHVLMRALHRRLEPRAMKSADGLMAVSTDYIEMSHGRYPELRDKPARTIRFGVSPRDWEIARARERHHGVFDPGDGLLHGACVGAYSAGMEFALRALFGAMRKGLDEEPALFSRLRLHFIGTSYGTPSQQEKRVETLARAAGVEAQVTESPGRIPYYAALQIQSEANFLILPGSSERAYVPSRLAGMVVSGRPILAICESTSVAAGLLNSMPRAFRVTYDEPTPEELNNTASAVRNGLRSWLSGDRSAAAAAVEPAVVERLLAPELARQQCELFDEIVGN